ncbi:MAG TPA: hypothetical protein H9915_02540 [Candidatus Gemmiger faecigallinarum]|nr:hypothetical protein [Candidatus Gemmiger faecigallinarum]
MKIKKRLVVGGVAVTVAALLFSGTFAWISGVQEATNRFVLEDYNVALHDTLDGTAVDNGGSHEVKWTPGVPMDKDIWISNDGSDDILVRVKLTETMKIRKGTETRLDVADAVHGSEEDAAIHEHVDWTFGEVKSYAEWKELTADEQRGAYWVLADDGYVYWMQPLTPSGDEDTAGAEGNTGLLVDAVTLKEDEEGAIEYTIDVEMDAIDAKLAGLTEEGATWTSDAAKELAAAATYDPIAEEIERIEEDLANPPSDDISFQSAYIAQKKNAIKEYQAAQAAATPEEKQQHLINAKWYDLFAESQIVGGEYVCGSNGGSNQYIMQVTSRTPGEGVVDEECTATLIMYEPGKRIDKLTTPPVYNHTSYKDNVYRRYEVTAVADGAFQNATAKNLDLVSWSKKPELLGAHTFDGLTATYVVIGPKSSQVSEEFLNAFKAGEYGVLANEVPEGNYIWWAK